MEQLGLVPPVPFAGTKSVQSMDKSSLTILASLGELPKAPNVINAKFVKHFR
jgi:hypothetical protein